ncbi:hypothetical protein AGMMS49928_25830 [Spirochaetia bacterium]|nr:hypothetical protein AGMMS49928_25830 [Spirochaetia bacterium]
MKILTAYSRDPDDPEKAVEDILGQLDLENRLLKNSAALLFCHTEFIKLGVAEALCKKLPFETAGCSSQCFAVNSAADEILLSLTVFTGDDMEFALGISEPLTEDAETRMEDAYRKTAASLSAGPSLIFALEPLMTSMGGDTITAALDRASGGDIPIFGTCAMDSGTKIRDPETFYQGKAYRDRTALLLISGPVKPRFFSALYPDKSVFAQDATITGARDNLIQSINNIPALAYLEKVGIAHRGGGIDVIPLLIDYGGAEEPEIIIMKEFTPEGALICSRKVQTGGFLNIGSTTADFVLETAAALCKNIRKDPDHSALFMFSCFSRNLALGDPMAETGVIQRELKDLPIPYVFCYSGGEICPQYTGPGETVNKFHQYALIACLL